MAPQDASPTSMPELAIDAATPEDIPHLTPLYLRSFSDQLSQRCFPRTASTAAFWTAMNTEEFTQATSHFLVVRETAVAPAASVDEAGSIVAYAKWNSPAQSATGDLVAGGGDDPDAMPEWPKGSDVPLANEFFTHLAHRRRHIMGARPHWYLEIVATLPAYRGRGLAGRLIQWGIQKADEMGVECYLEGGPGLVDFYRRWAFEVEETFEPEHLPNHVESLMRRPARTRKEE